MPGPIVVIFLLFSACDSRLPLWRRCGPGGGGGGALRPTKQAGAFGPRLLGFGLGPLAPGQTPPPRRPCVLCRLLASCYPLARPFLPHPHHRCLEPLPREGGGGVYRPGARPRAYKLGRLPGAARRRRVGVAHPPPPRKAGYIHAALLRAQSREDPLTFWLILLEWYMRPRRSFGTFPLTSVYLLAFGCRKSGLRHFFEVFIAPLRLRRGQGAMQGNPCYARLFADLPYMPPNPIKA